ncbi:tyrosyl-DNA phosphodiesterase I [Helicostylum pulchrum]|nr:tyrosyl-DNA phosphodiesterase I [Helicostylum pulchrum]
MATFPTNTTLTYSPYISPKENIGCVTLRDLVYHKDLESMVQFNFLVDVEFLLTHMYDTNIPITIIHGQKDPPRFNMNRTNIKVDSPEIRDRYGTHHTKAMLLFFRDPETGIKTVQLIVMTANLIQEDWGNMTQGVYRTSRCPLKSMENRGIWGTLIGSEYSSPFEHELIKYLKEYQLRRVFNILIQLKLYDWSSCKAILVGSVPGRHRGSSFKNWGIERLATVLRHNVDLPEPCRSSSQLILQCSSMAYSPQKWFDSLCRNMSESTQNDGPVRTPKICVVYPTVETATESITGRYTSGDFLRFEEKSYVKNHTWFDSYLYDWKSQNAGRQHIMPHIKTYTRVYQDTDGKPSVVWHLLTSSNLSRAAWGEYQINETQLYIKSFELGVFFCPSLWEDDSTDVVLRPATNSRTNAEKRKVVKVRLPYDLPLVRHSRPRQCFTRIE